MFALMVQPGGGMEVKALDLVSQIEACHRRAAIVRDLIRKARTRGETTADAEKQLALEIELLRTLQASQSKQENLAGPEQ